MPDKFIDVTLERRGYIVPDRTVSLKHLEAAWTALSWHRGLTLSIPGIDEKAISASVILDTCKWMFYPETAVEPTSRTEHAIIRLQCNSGILPLVMMVVSLLGAGHASLELKLI